jgi:hypothetical protein
MPGFGKFSVSEVFMSDEWITLRTFSQPLEAHIVKSKLESEGIDCALADENIVRIDWLWSNAVGGVKLKVHESQVEAANEILKSAIATHEPTETGVSCPSCKSGDIYLEPKHRRGILFWAFLVGIPIPFLNKAWICRDCGSVFDKTAVVQKD